MTAERHWENDWLIGPGMALDPSKYFILVTNMFGNGLSSSPSNTPPPFDRARFPLVTCQDFALCSYPDMMKCTLPFCGSARTSEHNKVHLSKIVLPQSRYLACMIVTLGQQLLRMQLFLEGVLPLAGLS